MPDDAATAVDVVLACRRVQRFLAGVDPAEFRLNEEKHWAVVSQLVLIGEAVRRLSESFQAARPQVRWKLIGGMRNRLTHEYDKIDWEVVWKTAAEDVPRLLAELEPIVEAQRRGEGA